MTDGPARCEASTRCDSAWRDAMRAAEARSQSTARRGLRAARRAATDGVWRAGASAGAGMSVGASVTLRAGGREHRVPRARRVTGAARGVARALVPMWPRPRALPPGASRPAGFVQPGAAVSRRRALGLPAARAARIVSRVYFARAVDEAGR
ncbi:PriA [Burkholderia pseudomallei]|nr:PriA [Burkholderia pseudomallei MSHR346]OMW31756.1 PriA [Burkholderia pseudomallei]ONA28168.1 PriA [Burkholderia pseudomallei]ONA28276.1 PriA [Burkholderia pseudomallei]ONA36930.1 PriA [Burkholderia pseudomallei]